MQHEARGTFLARHSPDVIYGAILLSALLGSLNDPLPGNLRIILITWLSLQVVSWAKAYSAVVRNDMERPGYTPWRAKWLDLLAPSWSMATLALPVAFFGLAMAGILTQTAALLATQVGLIVVLALLGFLARRLGGAGLGSSLWAGGSVALLGYVVTQIKLWTKYLPTVGQ